MRQAQVLIVAGSLALASPCWGVLGIGDLVYDPANHTTNILTSLQATVTAVQSVLQTGYMIIELTGIEDTLGAAEFLEDLATMQSLLSDARALSWDFKSIARQVDRLFNLKTAPDNTSALEERLREIDQVLYDVYSYATAVQSLVETISHTIDHMRGFIARIGALLGNRQALQSINESQAKMVQAQEKQALMDAAFNRAEAYQRLQEPLTNEALRRINSSLYSTLPRRR